jgi:hypothetical protein
MDEELTTLRDAVWKALEQVNLTTGALLAKVEEKVTPAVPGEIPPAPNAGQTPTQQNVPTTEGTESV